ncbi:MAG: acyl-CoA dehydrogenase, partial [Ginsengibacter sp.]
TGAAHATAFTANCNIEKDGKIVQDKDGSPIIAAFIFSKDEVSIHEDWKEIGMIATSSNSFEVMRVRVNKNRRFAIDEKQTVLSNKIYQYPFLQFAESTLAVNISGMAIHYLDLFEAIIKEGKDKHFKNEHLLSLSGHYERAKNQLDEARQAFYQTLERSWNKNSESKSFSAVTLEEVSKVSRQLASTSRRMLDEIFPYCGLVAGDYDSEINRVWRNLHIACLHPLLLQ